MMMGLKKAWMLVLAAGCATPAPPEPGFESPTPWRRDPSSGLAARLVSTGPAAVGKPIPVVVELENQGSTKVTFDIQGTHWSPYRLRRADGTSAPHIGARWRGQTMQQFIDLAPGASYRLLETDMTDLFPVTAAGDIDIEFTGLAKWGLHDDPAMTAVPPSAPLRIHVGDGVPMLRDRLAERLTPVVPQEWFLREGSRNEQGQGVELVFIRDSFPGRNIGATISVYAGRTTGRLLGMSPFGEIHLGDPAAFGMPPRTTADDELERRLKTELLPSVERDVRRALEVR